MALWILFGIILNRMLDDNAYADAFNPGTQALSFPTSSTAVPVLDKHMYLTPYSDT